MIFPNLSHISISFLNEDIKTFSITVSFDFQMVQLIASGQISQIGANALNLVKEASKIVKDQFCFYHETVEELVVETQEKKENAMSINVHVGFKNLEKILCVMSGLYSM